MPQDRAYRLIHEQTNRRFPRTGRCEFCARTSRKTGYAEARPGLRSHWRHDWFELCTPCHHGYDEQAHAAHQRAKTHCPQGHAYDEANTYRKPDGSRECRTCKRDEVRRWKRTGSSRRAMIEAFSNRQQTISVCLPAKNEAATIGAALAPVMALHRAGYVDQVVVTDQSDDATPDIAQSLGAEVHRTDEIFPELGPTAGKGDNLWRALQVLHGDVLLYLDSDSTSVQRHYVFAMCAPILTGEAEYVKAFYQRPLGGDPDGGGRLNHLFGAPVMRTFFPDLAWVKQPLAGETALTRDLAWRIPYEVGMAIEPALTIDAHLAGARMTQVDLDVHEHRHWPLRELAQRCDEAMAAVLDRAGVPHQLSKLSAARPPMRDYLAHAG